MDAEKHLKKSGVGKDISTVEMIVIVTWLFSASIAKGIGLFGLEIKEIVIIAFASLGVFAPITFSIWLDKVLEFLRGKKC